MPKIRKILKLIEVGGTPYEIGYQYGEACPGLREFIDQSYEGLGWKRHGMIPSIQKYIYSTEKFAPEIIETIKGIADGGKVNFDEIFFLNTLFEVGMFEFLKPIMGCTLFAAIGDTIDNTETICGQNVDYFPESEDGFMLLKIIPQKGPQILGLVQFMGGLPLLGINSTGICLNINALLHKDSINNYNGIPLNILTYKMLCCKNVTKALGVFCSAVKSFETKPLFGCYLASSEGSAVYCEAVLGDYNILYPENGIITHANHYETNRFKSGESIHVIVPDSFFRARRLRDLITKNHHKLNVAKIEAFLADHVNFPYSICKHYGENDPIDTRQKTVLSIISQLKKQKMHIAWGNPCDTEFHEYCL